MRLDFFTKEKVEQGFGRLLFYGSMLLISACAVGLIVHTAIQIKSLYIPIPWGDINSEFHWLHKHGVRFWDLFRPHNEHIILVPRLFFLVDFFAFAATGKFLLISSFILLLMIVIIMAAVAERWFFTSRRDALMYGSIVAICYINASHMFNLLCGLMIQHWLEIFFCLLFALFFALLFEKALAHRQWQFMAILAVLGFCVVFSSGSGVFCLVAAVIVAILFRLGWKQTLCLGLILVSTVGLFLLCNKNPAAIKFSAVLKEPKDAAVCFLSFLGAPGMRYHMWPADKEFWTFLPEVVKARGAVVFFLGLGLCFREWLQPSRRSVFSIFHVHLILLVFLIAAAFVPSRMGIDVYEGVNTKYTNTVLLAWIAIFSLAMKQLVEGGLLGRGQRQFAWTAVAMLTGLLVVPGHFREIKIWSGWTDHLWESETALIVDVYDEDNMRTLDFRPRELYDIMQREFKPKRWAVFSQYPFAMGDPLRQHFQIVSPYATTGNFDLPGGAPESVIKGRAITGWAWDETKQQPFRDILITDDEGRIRGFAHSVRDRYDVIKYFNDNNRMHSGWYGWVRQEKPTPLFAYGVIGNSRRVCLIAKL